MLQLPCVQVFVWLSVARNRAKLRVRDVFGARIKILSAPVFLLSPMTGSLEDRACAVKDYFVECFWFFRETACWKQRHVSSWHHVKKQVHLMPASIIPPYLDWGAVHCPGPNCTWYESCESASSCDFPTSQSECTGKPECLDGVRRSGGGAQDSTKIYSTYKLSKSLEGSTCVLSFGGANFSSKIISVTAGSTCDMGKPACCPK